MPKRMLESHRVRGSKRIRCLITNVRFYGRLTCVYCLDNLDENNLPYIDHVKSRVTGGGHDMDNLVACCNPCNGRKCHKSVAKVFGQVVSVRVRKHISRRTLTLLDYEVSIEISRATKTTADRIVAVLDWVQLGFLPMPHVTRHQSSAVL